MSTKRKSKHKSNSSFDAEFDSAIKVAQRATAQDVKVPISVRLDSDIYLGLKERAKEQGIPYQTLLNKVLRRYVMLEQDEVPVRVNLLRSEFKRVITELFNEIAEQFDAEDTIQKKSKSKKGA